MKTAILFLAAFCCICSALAAEKSYQANEIPKYGEDPDYQTIWQNTDKSGRADNIENSKNVTARGWELLGKGDSLTAIKRFNQGWTLWPGNYKAVWGMAIVMFTRAKEADSQRAAGDCIRNLDKGVKLMKEARGMAPGDAPLLTDMALLHATRGMARLSMKTPGSEKDFQAAEELLKSAEKIEKHPHIYETWALLEEYRGNTGAVKKYEQLARELRKK